MTDKTIRLTMAQALVKYLCNQYTLIDNKEEMLFSGVFGIFGHGNVTCLAEALEKEKQKLPTWRGQNEQSMALAAIAYAKAKKRKQIMIATSSIGPGATNMVTAAAVAHSNRLPILILSGDVFSNRRPDPVLQQVEHFGNPSISVNDSFKPVSRYWDRITHPEQIMSSLPQAIATMMDPGDCGPAFIGLCQDTQEIAFDYPKSFFDKRHHYIKRPRPDSKSIEDAVKLIINSKNPLIISGGGVRYSGAEKKLASFAEKFGIPISETIAGKGSVTHNHPAHVGPIGVVGSTSANELGSNADLIIAIGTRLQDFTTGSWTVFSHEAKILTINTSRWDATKHQSFSVIGDALVAIEEIESKIDTWKADNAWTSKAKDLFQEWNNLLNEYQKITNSTQPTYAQVVGMINKLANDKDTIVAAAGGLPGEVAKGWKIKGLNTFDCEFGFSCMGYEIAGGWGHAMASSKDSTPIVLVGDGSYMMMNSDIWSTVLSGHKMIVIVCDNGGYAVINRLQNFKGGASFNNLIQDSKVQKIFNVDFVKHAESMGAMARHVESLADLENAFSWARKNDVTTIISINTDPNSWVPGDASWDVGVPEISDRKEVQDARKAHDEIRKKQRVGF